MAKEKDKAPQVLKIAVSGVTELLRLFSPSKQTRYLCHLCSMCTVSGVLHVFVYYVSITSIF